MEFWTIKDGQVGEGVGREKGWKFLSLSLSLWWAQVRQSKSWRRHRVRIVEQKESFACWARIYCLAGMSSVSGTDVDEWIKRKHEVWIIESGRVRKIQKQSCKVCDGFKKRDRMGRDLIVVEGGMFFCILFSVSKGANLHFEQMN